MRKLPSGKRAPSANTVKAPIQDWWISVWHGEIRVRCNPENRFIKTGGILEGEIVQKTAQQGLWLRHQRGWSVIRDKRDMLLVPFSPAHKNGSEPAKVHACRNCSRLFVKMKSAERHKCEYFPEEDEDPSLGKTGKHFPVCRSREQESPSWAHNDKKPGTEMRYQCTQCWKSVETLEHLKRHFMEEHGVEIKSFRTERNSLRSRIFETDSPQLETSSELKDSPQDDQSSESQSEDKKDDSSERSRKRIKLEPIDTASNGGETSSIAADSPPARFQEQHAFKEQVAV